MTDQDLIKKLQSLKHVEANQEWLVSMRQNLFSTIDFSVQTRNASSFGFSLPTLTFRMAFALGGFLFIAVASGTLVFANASLPGDPLYGVKLASEGVQNSLPASFLSQAQRQEAVAQRRVDELAQIAQSIDTSTASPAKKDLASAVAKQVKSYNQALQQTSVALNQPNAQNNKDSDKDVAKAKDEAGIIQQSAQTLAIVLHETDNSVDMEKVLRATVGNRLPDCKDKQMFDQIQKLLSSDEIADLISANELSVRCTDANE